MSWVGRSAGDIAAAVRRGETTAPEVVAEHIEAIRARADLAAFRVIRERAVEEARALQERTDLTKLPLAGVPVAIKDNLPVAGETMRNGSEATPTEPSPADHPTVARLRAAGAVVIGLTNVNELSVTAFSDSPYGVPRNPWDPGRTPGGSSGGSATAVAAGLVPLALGNDALGSIRIPAACCGLVGVKPGPGVVPSPPQEWFGLSENGPLATNVADLALMLAVLADDVSLISAWETGERRRVAWAPDPGRGRDDDTPGQVARAWRSEPLDLRITTLPRPLPPLLPVDREFQAAVAEAGATLRADGQTVVDHGRPLPFWLSAILVPTWLRAIAENAEGLPQRHLEQSTRSLARAGRVLGALRLQGRGLLERWRASGADQWFGDADVIIMPSLAQPPPPLQRMGHRGLLRNLVANVRYAPVAGAWNLAGWPAISVPFGRHSSGLPIGVQLVAPPGGEPHLLHLAARLEAARPWPRHAPTTRKTETV